MGERRVTWKSRIGAMFAFMAATVGLGSLWRFPYKVGMYGGAAFLVAYFTCYLLIGIPAYIGETVFGKLTRKGPAGAFKKAVEEVKARKEWSLIGHLTVIFGTILNAQYLVVVGWTIIYLGLSLTGSIFTMDQVALENLWSNVFPGWISVVGLLIATLYCTVSIICGVSEGIEKVTSVLMPILFIILIIGCIRSLTLEGAFRGVEFLFMPNIEKLFEASTWLQALGQVYFTTALGIGFIITYGSYMSKKQSVTWNTYMVAIGDNLASILAGLAIFPAVFALGLHPAAGAKLAFVVLPQVFARMPFGAIFGVMFFLGFAIAALEATKPAFEVATSYLVDEFKWDRTKAALIVAAVELILGIAAALSFQIWDLFDRMWTTIPPLMGLFTSVFIGWKLDVEKICREENIGRWWIYTIKYATPIGITIVFMAYVLVNLGIISF